MIVLPNSFERYLSALRLCTTLSTLKHGILPRHLENLKKIYKAEAYYYKNRQQSVDVKTLCNNLLGAVATIKSDFKFFVEVKGNYLINQQLFTCLLLTAAQDSNVKITASGKFIMLFFFEGKHTVYPLINALGGFFLKDNKTLLSLAVIPVFPTTQKAGYTNSEWEYLFDKFSVVNIFFNGENLYCNL